MRLRVWGSEAVNKAACMKGSDWRADHKKDKAVSGVCVS